MLYNADASKTFIATGDLSAKQYTVVKMDSTANQIVNATAGTDKSIGILMNKPVAGDVAEVRLRTANGTYPAVAGGSINVGDALTATTGGKVIATTTAGDQIIGYALFAAASNDIVEIMPSTGKY